MDYKKQSFKDKTIKDLNTEKDVNVSVIGKIIDIKDDIAIIDDGTGTIRVIFENSAKDLKVGDIIKVFGQLITVQGSPEIRVEVYSVMKGLDLNLYKKYLELRDENV
ncbi:MAG: hypothetical protein J7L15_02965 [Clostridiales bacterium]|nr:hypothetical protein [Clostridiales bacterium]